MLSIPFGTIAGASFMCALRQLSSEATTPHGDASAVCDVLDIGKVLTPLLPVCYAPPHPLSTISRTTHRICIPLKSIFALQDVLLSAAQHLMSCYHSCMVDDEKKPPPTNMAFIPVDTSGERAESPDSVLVTPGIMAQVNSDRSHSESPDIIIPICKSPRPLPKSVVDCIIRARSSGKRSKNTE